MTRHPCPFHLDCWDPCPIAARVHEETKALAHAREGRRLSSAARARCGAAASRTQGSRALIKATMIAPKRGK
jgi:hypothetical protein